MKRQKNQPNWSFIVQVSTQGGLHVRYVRIDQRVEAARRARSLERIRNQVKERLSLEASETGLVFHVIYEGNPEMATAVLEAEAACPF